MHLHQGCLLLTGCLTAAAWLPPGGEPVRAGNPKPPVRTDLHGDPLPEGARARLGTVRFQTVDYAVGLAVSPDNRIIACLGDRGIIALLDLKTGKHLRQLSGPRPTGGSLVFSPDGRRLASSGEGGIVVWDVRTGQVALRLPMDQPTVSLAFARDGRALVSATWDGNVQQWDLATGKELWRFAIRARASDSLALSADGRLLARGGTDGVLQIWDLAAGKEVWKVAVRPVQIHRVVFSPDSKFLACDEFQSPKHFVCLRDAASGKEVRRFGGSRRPVSLLVFSPSGKRIATSLFEDQDIRLWEVATGEPVRRLWQWYAFAQAAFAPDGQTLVTSEGPMVRLWDMATGRRIPRAGGHASGVSSLAFSPDGKLLASSSEEDDDREVRLWDVRTARELPPLGGDYSETQAVAFSPDGKRIASAKRGLISVWDVASRKRLSQFGDPRGRETPLAFTPDGQSLLAIREGGPRLLDPETGKPARFFQPPNGATHVALSSDGKLVASVHNIASDGIDLLDGRTGKTLWHSRIGQYPNNIAGDTILAFSPGRALLASMGHRDLRLWDLTSGKLLRWTTVVPQEDQIYCLAFSPDGRALALAGREIHLLELATGKERCRLKGHKSTIWSLAFSPDGRLLASGSADTTILLWDLSRLPQRK
jgi:WD40 repeat protein